MATTNPFDLLGADDVEDPSVFIAAQEQMAVAAKPAVGAGKPAAKLPSKPLPPSQAVREARNDTGRGGRGGRGFVRGRGSGGPNRDFTNSENSFSNDNGNSMGYKEDREFRNGGYGGRNAGSRGGRRGGFSNGDGVEEERPRRVFERRSGTGRGSEVKREGSGRGNWGSATDEIAPETELPIAENEENNTAEKPAAGEDNVITEKENPVIESEEKEPEEKQMTLDEYEKVLEEKRKALMSMKVEERKVKVDKELQSMQVVSKKNNDEEIFIKLGSDKDKKKEAAEKEEKAKKCVSINEFLKPAEGETYYRGGGRGRGRGRGRGDGFGERASSGGRYSNNVSAPKIEDPSQFPTLGAK